MGKYEVYCCGSNGSGQLGLSHDEDINTPAVCFRSKNQIVNLGKGDNHTLILLDNGDVYACGKSCGYFRNSEGLLKRDTDEFVLVAKNCTNVAASWEFSVIVQDESKVIIYSPKDVKQFKVDGVVDYIRTSLDGMLISCNSGGTVYAFGNNRKGQLLGIPSTLGSVSGLVRLDLPLVKHVNKICMGRDYSIILAERGTGEKAVYMLGKSDRYDILRKMSSLLGEEENVVITEDGVNQCRHFVLRKGVRIIGLQSMWSSVHVMYETEGNEVQFASFGNDNHKQCFRHCEQLRLTPESKFDVGTEHGVILNQSSSEAFAWGWGEHGNCGFTSQGELGLLYKAEKHLRIESVFAGYATTFIVVVATE